MQAARRRSAFDLTSRLGRRAEAGPRRVLPRVSRLGLRRRLKHDVYHASECIFTGNFRPLRRLL